MKCRTLRTVPYGGKMHPAGAEIEADAGTVQTWLHLGWVETDQAPKGKAGKADRQVTAGSTEKRG